MLAVKELTEGHVLLYVIDLLLAESERSGKK